MYNTLELFMWGNTHTVSNWLLPAEKNRGEIHCTQGWFQAVPPTKDVLPLRWFMRLVLCHALVISHTNQFHHKLTKHCLQLKATKLVCWFFLGWRKVLKAYCTSDGTVCMHCIKELAFSVFPNPILIYVLLYRINSGIKYSIYDCIIV